MSPGFEDLLPADVKAKLEAGEIPMIDPDDERLELPVDGIEKPAIGAWQGNHPDTAKQAAIALYPKSGTQRARVLEAWRVAGDHGATDDEVAASTGIARARTRRQELMEKHAIPIRDSGRRRPSAAGNPAIVWVLDR